MQRGYSDTASVCSQASCTKGLTKMTAAPVDFAPRVTTSDALTRIFQKKVPADEGFRVAKPAVWH